MKIRLWPKAINYRGKQNFFFCTIKIEGCDPEKINADSVLLYYDDVANGIPPMSSKTYKRVEELMVRFDMEQVRDMLKDVDLEMVTLHVVGTLNDLAKTDFEGTDKLKIYRTKKAGTFDEFLQKQPSIAYELKQLNTVDSK